MIIACFITVYFYVLNYAQLFVQNIIYLLYFNENLVKLYAP